MKMNDTSLQIANEFDEIGKILSDDSACMELLAGLKWAQTGYSCRRCEYTLYCGGNSPYSRRCTKCGYIESAQRGTVFENCKISLPVAFQLVMLLYVTKGKISSYELSRRLNVRQNTCLFYSQKINRLLKSKRSAHQIMSYQNWLTFLVSPNNVKRQKKV
ncbi:hypothetical protein LLH06_10885 [Mucilaginibacter daejeonensis]|uniref:hypothetical protein n=1 Tax=Mucilaginibacter daejeonensis TaxID=398049 RepID=UPI001D174CA2|nr:hypothetical protein [Mucilaginibacter daejeonensis]UEG51479.1 hypothetical protein LLH06_10885 [Mucilaginibacter daejeonensis]